MYLNKIWINYPHKYNGTLKTIDVSTTKNEEVDACYFWCDIKKLRCLKSTSGIRTFESNNSFLKITILKCLCSYVGVSNFFLGGGAQLPIPTRYKMSVWGDQSPHTLNSWPGGTSPPQAHVCLCYFSGTKIYIVYIFYINIMFRCLYGTRHDRSCNSFFTCV